MTSTWNPEKVYDRTAKSWEPQYLPERMCLLVRMPDGTDVWMTVLEIKTGLERGAFIIRESRRRFL